MAMDMSFLIADQNYYEPWDTADLGLPYRAEPMPAGWTRHPAGAWTHWVPPGLILPDRGWKVHVSSDLLNAQSVLAVVSVACAELVIPFKHLAGRRAFLVLHDKHGPRVQAGKFCTIYPSDEQHALRLMQRLEAELAGINGPYVLTDRRFGDSECVSYRYGSFRARTRVDAEGNHVPTMIALDGQEIVDDRRPKFSLPPGLTDPFRPAATSRPPGPATFRGYTYETVIQHSNAGGAYRFRTDAGEQVFIKEARSHNGYTGDGADAKTRLNAEYLTLRALHGRVPGLCPRPIELFHHWEHSYLVSELVPGVPLYRWMVTNNPIMRLGTVDAAAFAAYHDRCLALLDQLDGQLRQLHELGYVFIDLSPNNVLIDEDDQLRLVDFEGAQPVDDVRRIMGTPGYQSPNPRSLAESDPRELDRYGLAALALLLLFPVHEVAERHAAILNHLHADLSELAPVNAQLWQRATRYYQPGPDAGTPTPEAVRQDTITALRWLADQTADALEAMAQPDHPLRVYPTTPLGFQTDTRSVATGTAGVLHALHQAGRTCDPAIVRRLRDEALDAVERAAPGLLFGTAGIACVLAELGETDAAHTLLAAAAKHPLNDTSATLGGGAAGTALGLLIQHQRTGEAQWLELAQQLLERLPAGAELTAQLSSTRQSGLVGGRPGVALALYYLHRVTGEDAPFDQGLRLLQRELAYSQPIEVGGLGFRTSPTDRRVYPYLFAGSASYATVLSRYLAHRPAAQFAEDADLTASDALESCLQACTGRFPVFPGLFPGLSGLVVALAGAGRRLGRPELIDLAVTNARGLFRHAIPHRGGVGWLGEPGQRFSADLWSGSAGVLLGLSYLTDPRPNALDALDEHPTMPTRVTASTPVERRDHHGRSPVIAG